jgi:subtilase family serine protease
MPGNHNVFCWGGTIGPGGSAEFVFEVISEDIPELCGEKTVGVQAIVDPHSWILEVNETNNAATTGVLIANIC